MLSDVEPGWLWAIGGVILLIAEVVAPGFFLLFIGAAALATGLFTILFGLGLAPQLVLFALYAALAVALGKRFYAQPDNADIDPLLNDRSARMIGKTVVVVDPVDDHGGRVKVGDSEWNARGGPAAAGDQVVIIAVDGNCLSVEPRRNLPPA